MWETSFVINEPANFMGESMLTVWEYETLLVGIPHVYVGGTPVEEVYEIA